MKMNQRKSANLVATLAIFSGMLCTSPATGEPAPLPYHIAPYQGTISKMVLAPNPNAGAIELQSVDPQQPLAVPKVGPYVTIESVGETGAPWIQVVFSDFNLGVKSTLTVRSSKDGDEQTFTDATLRQWNGTTAAFNGDSVNVILNVAPGETGVFYQIQETAVGERRAESAGSGSGSAIPLEQGGGGTEALCDADNRLLSQDKRVGRIMPVGCTGWIISNGAHLTAGHCSTSDMVTLQFNVPHSLEDGTPVMPPAKDQYAINTSSVKEGIPIQVGNDWAVFAVARNTETNQLPIEVQGSFQISENSTPKKVRISGYGVDRTPPGPLPGNGFLNNNSQVQQTSDGELLPTTVNGADIVVLSYLVDTEGGNSGAPVIAQDENGKDTDLTIGIHTNAGCNVPSNQGNHGTGFANTGLLDAIQKFKPE